MWARKAWKIYSAEVKRFSISSNNTWDAFSSLTRERLFYFMDPSNISSGSWKMFVHASFKKWNDVLSWKNAKQRRRKGIIFIYVRCLQVLEHKGKFQAFLQWKVFIWQHFLNEHLWKENTIIVRHEMCIIKHKNHINVLSWDEETTEMSKTFVMMKSHTEI